MSQEEEIIKKLQEQARHREITAADRDRAMLKVLNQQDTPAQMKNAWECITKFYETTKAMGSPMHHEALAASVFINKLRATYEIYGPDTDSDRQPVDQSPIGQQADDSVL